MQAILGGATARCLLRRVGVGAAATALGDLHQRPGSEHDDDETGERQRQHGPVGGVGEDRPEGIGHRLGLAFQSHALKGREAGERKASIETSVDRARFLGLIDRLGEFLDQSHICVR